MDEHTMRTIASDMMLIAIAILVPTLMLMPTTWKRFLTCLRELRRKDRGRAFKESLFYISIPGFFAGIIWLSYTINPIAWFRELPYIAILSALLLNVLIWPLAIFSTFRWKRNKSQGSETTNNRRDISKETAVISSLLSLALLAMPSLLLVMATSVSIAVGVTIESGYVRENFEFARASVIVGMLGFACGLMYLAISYLPDLMNFTSDSDNDA